MKTQNLSMLIFMLAFAAIANAENRADIESNSEQGLSYFTNSAIMPVYRLDDTANPKSEFCIPSGSSFRRGSIKPENFVAVTVTGTPLRAKNGKYYADDLTKTLEIKFGLDQPKEKLLEKKCVTSSGKKLDWADPEYVHIVKADTLADQDFRRYGVTTGVLVVPFKYHLGEDNKLSSSATVAPYGGVMFESFKGLNAAWIVSAGLGVVPINDPATNSTETKAALSLSSGFIFSNRYSKTWSAGLLYGQDLLSGADKKRDPSAGDPWISIFVGTAIK